LISFFFLKIANLLWRLQNGEMPSTLQPKVWWILVGSNDLVRGQCSEEAIILGILRLADEIALVRPGSVIVIQGLLPRTPHADGTLGIVSNTGRRRSPFHSSHSLKEYVKSDEYPLWPFIEVINQELERFCAKHDHLVYFDADAIFVGSVGNEHFQSSNKFILKELMPDYAHLSIKGHEVFLKVIAKELNRIIFESDEENHKAGEDDEDVKKL
jgi:lysophospholipase L1-like esterase